MKALAEDANISQLSTDHDVSRKFTYAQKAKAQEALGQAFAPSQPADDVLFSLPVTATWLNQFIVSLTLICHSSYRGVVEFVRDMLGVSVSLGRVHDLLAGATKRAAELNLAQDLSAVGCPRGTA